MAYSSTLKTEVTPQKIVLFIATAVKTSNPALIIFHEEYKLRTSSWCNFPPSLYPS
jgi:hypothetical protein